MPLPVIEFRYLETIHSPFSGLPSESEDGPNEEDPTLLFTYYGMASMYGFINPRLAKALPDELAALDVDLDLDPAELADGLHIDGGLTMVVDTDWNGINYYGFAPTDSDVTFTARDK
jgi:hypothetical protein